MSQHTPSQQKAIASRGNVLVVAGAGAGKTRTLVERCVQWLVQPGTDASLDQILMVTFTEAAATEMRRRLRQALETSDLPPDRRGEQLALLETAHICTLHSFCLQLVRRHCCELGLDPHSTVLASEQEQMLAHQMLDALLEENFRGATPIAQAVQQLIQDQGRGWDKPVRDLIMRLHAYTQTLPDPERWFHEQIAQFENPKPHLWEKWFAQYVSEWKGQWRRALENPSNGSIKLCVDLLKDLKGERAAAADCFKSLLEIRDQWPRGQAGLRKPEKLFEETEFWLSLCPTGDGDPLQEDWDWAKPQVLPLLQLAREFSRAFSLAKREAGGLDFHDLEQFALRLLWDKQNARCTPLAEGWRKKFRLIFVDEYQDINAAQDAIICALGGEGTAANRFLVGDVKQSIYRFRLANPRIFLDYQKNWKIEQPESVGQVITLSENFRSHEGILRFVNALFSALMTEELGGIEYDDSAQLRFGNPAERTQFSSRPGDTPLVELHICCAPGKDAAQEDSEFLTQSENEARVIAHRLLELKSEPLCIWENGVHRPVRWSDMVILLRAPRGRVESYVKMFAGLGVPITATQGGFYESLEISDLLSVLQLLDNPLQDWPLLAVLRSPLVGLSADELACIRASCRHGRFWTALLHWHNVAESTQRTELHQKLELFLKRFREWRRLTRQLCVSQCLETVIEETRYADWLTTQDRAEQRRANVERLLQMARQFDDLQGEGLYRFLAMVQLQRENERDAEPAVAPVGDSVRLMSIHQSKGLEFPVVVLADLGKKFNQRDATGRVILDEEFGLCPQLTAPQSRQYYPSLPFWLAQQRQKRESCGEELRLLYVATTRAAQRLILCGTTRLSALEEKWPELAQKPVSPAELLASGSYLDWIGPWLVRLQNGISLQPNGNNSLLCWKIYDRDSGLMASTGDSPTAESASVSGSFPTQGSLAQPAQISGLKDRLRWRYLFEEATRQAAKSSVTVLRRQLADDPDETEPLFDSKALRIGKSKEALDAKETGLAYHAFFEHVSLERVGTLPGLQQEAARLCREKFLTPEQVNALNLEAIACFWNSEMGESILAHRNSVRRELPFTARLSKAELDALGSAALQQPIADLHSSDFIVIQGVIDLAVLLPDQIWIVDFKTDRISDAQLGQKIASYQPQLALYAKALSSIYARPVTRCVLYFLALNRVATIESACS